MKTKNSIVYEGAVRSIREGEYPVLEEMVPSAHIKRDTVNKDAKTAVSQAVSPLIFRAYDIRGIVNRDLSIPIIREIGRSIGSTALALDQKKLVVAKDSRFSSLPLSEALIEGLCSTGCDVIDIGFMPTPVLYFATHYLETGSGVMITGSHNPIEYNGLKIMLAGKTLSGDAITALHERIINNELSSGEGTCEKFDVSQAYIDKIVENIETEEKKVYKIIVDCSNGVASELAPKLYRALGHEVVELFCNINGSFPNHNPDPSQPENLQDLIRVVRSKNADMGFAFDGDGDRFGIVDNKGNIIVPDRQLMLFAEDVLSRNKGAPIVFDVKCSSHLQEIIEKNGGQAVMCKTGHSFIKSKMQEINAPLAGEMSGHIFFQERWYGFDDALYAGARVLEILTKSNKSIYAIFSSFPNDLATPELKIPLPEQYHDSIMQKIKEAMNFSEAKITTIDGVRVDFSDGWGLVRPSNTSPCLVVRFEAKNEKVMRRIQKDFRDLLNIAVAGMKLPF